MEKLNQKKIAIASGAASLVVYIGCILIMTIFGANAIIKLSNLLFHGVDFSSIVRMDIPVSETILGLVVSFVFWSLIGYSVGFFYNKIA